MATPPGFRISGCRGVRGFANYGFRVSRVRFSGFSLPTWALPARGFEDSRIPGFRDWELRVARKVDSGIPSFRDCEISNSGSRAKWIQVFRDSVLFRTARESLRISRKLAGAPIILHRASASRTSSRKLGRAVYTFYMYERRG